MLHSSGTSLPMSEEAELNKLKYEHPLVDRYASKEMRCILILFIPFIFPILSVTCYDQHHITSYRIQVTYGRRPKSLALGENYGLRWPKRRRI